jgi:hypothetical protein
MSLLQFASENPWLSFFLSYIILHTLCWVINRILRTIKVLARGWPTMPNMDADGDIVHQKNYWRK